MQTKVEKFKSHNKLLERCQQLIEKKESVCQSIIDYVSSITYLCRFNLQTDYIYQESDETSDTYKMWKVGREHDIYYI